VAAFLPHLTYYEFKMVDHRTRTTHAEKNQGEIFKVRDHSRGDRYLDTFLPLLTYYEFKMVDHRTRTNHAEKNQGEIFKVRDQSREERHLPAPPHLL
jgi:hypothetical protein